MFTLSQGSQRLKSVFFNLSQKLWAGMISVDRMNRLLMVMIKQLFHWKRVRLKYFNNKKSYLSIFTG